MAKITPEVEKRIPNLPEREPYDHWNSPDYRHQKRVVAQDEERKDRKEVQALAARMKALTDPVQMSRKEYYKRPLAGDCVHRVRATVFNTLHLPR